MRPSICDCRSMRPKCFARPRISFAGVVFCCLVFLLIGTPAAGQTNVVQGQPNIVEGWDGRSVGSLGVPDGTTDICIPAGSLLANINFTNGHILDIGAPANLFIQSTTQFANSSSSAFMNNSGSLVNNGTLVNESLATVNNFGTLNNNGPLSNQLSSTLVNAFFATLNNNSGGLLTNDASSTITNNFILSTTARTTLTTSGTINGTGLVLNSGTIQGSC